MEKIFWVMVCRAAPSCRYPLSYYSAKLQLELDLLQAFETITLSQKYSKHVTNAYTACLLHHVMVTQCTRV